ncbi:MAG: leucine-rich repeat protein [Bacilli bacterium]|nr:leucine-rich repeat protein [Bacilli bacterium]
MKLRSCTRCGENLVEQNGVLKCPYCGATYDQVDEAQKLEELLEAKKQELLANRRRVLWQETHRAHPSKKEILKAAQAVRDLVDDDELATFYVLIHQDDMAPLLRYLETKTVHPAVAEEVVNFATKSLDMKMTLPLKSFVERHFKGERYFQFMSAIEKEAEALEDGLYMTSIPRDVFLAYSSKDMPKVVDMADFLEGEGFTVFCALRNLRHGAGSAEFYLSGLHDAMKHCKAFVFLSSVNSRTTECDALKEEIPFVLDNLPNIKRVHYRLDDDGEPKMAASILLKEFDDGREWCRSKEDLVARLLAREKKRVVEEEEDEEEESSYPYHSEIDDDGFTVLHQNQEYVTTEYGTLQAYNGYAKKIRLGEDITCLGKQALKGSYTVEELDLGGVKILSPMCFNGAQFLEKIVGGHRLDTVGIGAFAGTPRLKSVDNPKTGVYKTLPNGMIMDPSRGRLLRYLGSAKKLTEDDFKDVEEIDPGAFAFNDSLESVRIPGHVQTIDKGAFAGCQYLRTVNLDKGILVIGKNAFAQCPNLTVYVNSPRDPNGWEIGYAGTARVVHDPV